MIELYATWLMLPTLLSRFVQRLFSKRAAFWAAVLVVATIAATQSPDTNKDRQTYNFLIDAIQDYDQISMEPGFYLLVRLLGSMLEGENLYAAFYFLVAAVSIAIKLRLFETYGGSMFGCLLAFLSYFFLLQDITQIRTGLAIALLYLSWFSYADGRTRNFWLFGFLATMFHVSCVLFMVAPVFRALKNWRQCAMAGLAVVSIAAVGWVAGSPVLGAIDLIGRSIGIEKIVTYLELLDEGVLSEITPLRLIPHTLLLLSTAFLWRRWRKDTLLSLLTRINFVGICAFVLLSPIPAIAYRVSDLFLFSGIFMIGRLGLYIPKQAYRPLVVGYTGFFLVYTIQFSGLFVSA